MTTRRLDRVNSLLKEVISEVINKDLRNPHLPRLITITNVEVTKDLQHAKVYFSVIGNKEQKDIALSVLQSSANFIRITASHQVTMRYFPDLHFVLDESVEKQIHMEELISKIKQEREAREKTENTENPQNND